MNLIAALVAYCFFNKKPDIRFDMKYPDIKKAYYLTMQLGLIYRQTMHADVVLTKFARWYDQADKSGFLAFGTIVRTIQSHYLEIVNSFHNRSTNAASESESLKQRISVTSSTVSMRIKTGYLFIFQYYKDNCFLNQADFLIISYIELTLYYIHLFAFYTPKPVLWIKKPMVSFKTFF
jgi:hypothetical protein